MEELVQDLNQLNVRLNNNPCVPNSNLLVNLKFTNSCIKKCCNIIFIFSLHMCLFVMVVGAEVSKTTIVVNVGGEISLPCPESDQFNSSELSWSHPGKLNMTGSFVVKETGALVLMKTIPSDAGMYYCKAMDQTVAQVKLEVNNVPSRINRVLVSTNSVYSIVSWSEPKAGGYPILGYKCQYRMDTSHFLSPSPISKEYSEKRLAADSRTCDIYNLVPNTTYFIQVAAYNKLGQGEFNSQMTTTKPLDEVHKTPSFVQTSESGRVLAMSIAVSVIALATLGSGIALLLIRHRGQSPPVRPLQESPGEDESLELVPHITLNPSFNIDMLEHIAPDFNENSEHAFLVGSPTGRER